MRSIYLPSIILLLTGLSISCRQQPPPAVGLITEKVMVVSARSEASQIGIDILKQGGNAIDAAVATQFALAVCYPQAGNIGGGGFAVIRMKDGQHYSLDFRETAPQAASRNMYLDSSGNVIKDLSWFGHQAVGVPGTVAGMVALHDSLGRLSWEEVIAPAIDLAKRGVPLSYKQLPDFRKKLPQLLSLSQRPTPFHQQSEWEAGDTVFYPALAETLTYIQRGKQAGFYQGPVADSIVAEMKRGNGLITHADLMAYHAIWREPIIGTYRGHTVIGMPPPSSGGIALLQLLKSVEAYSLSSYDWLGAHHIHLFAEAERRVFADRATHLGDPAYWPVPVSGLTDSNYNTSRMADFDPSFATESESLGAGKPLVESPQTTHFSIVDEDGNAVAITTTLNGSYGSCVFVGGCGFLLNNEMDDFSSRPGFPNAYGLLGAEANAIAAGKRMLSSMTPTILEKEGKLYMVVGSPGGSTIITSVFQTITHTIDFQLPLQAAVNAPRFHHQWKPNYIFHEPEAFSSRQIKSLNTQGHQLREMPSIGRVDAILLRKDGSLEGAADPRGDDTAKGY